MRFRRWPCEHGRWQVEPGWLRAVGPPVPEGSGTHSARAGKSRRRKMRGESGPLGQRGKEGCAEGSSH